MSNNITLANLEAVVARINRVTNSPEKQYSYDADNRLIANPGNYHLDAAYGGYSLARMSNGGGASSDVLNSGKCSKRQLYDLMFAFLAGFDAGFDAAITSAQKAGANLTPVAA